MIASRVQEFISTQCSSNKCTHIPFRNESTTQLSLHSQPDLKQNITTLLKKYKSVESNKSDIKSKNHREKGNRLFRENKKLNAFEASRCYTEAIFSAPEGSTALSLAHANRSAALAEIGYFKEAYEDCQCAVDSGYPKENLQKVICRQASCALKLKDYEEMSICLEKLRTMNLSEPFAREAEMFEKEIEKLEVENVKKDSNSQANILNQNILTHPQKGRYMTASKVIDTDEVILVEKAFSFVPIKEFIVCSGCAAQNIVPFPCNKCSRVFYCSLKCKSANETVHRFECHAYRIGLLDEIGVTHCALNMLLTGFPGLIPRLSNFQSVSEVWDEIERFTKTMEVGYAMSLSLVTNLHSWEPSYVDCLALNASIMTFYLKDHTTFFELFKECSCSEFDWEIIISALLLRHSAQTIANANTNYTVVCFEKPYVATVLSNIWRRPQHLKKGLLYKFSAVSAIYSGIFPHLSMCNHSCAPSLNTKFDGNRVTATARYPLVQGEEIYNGYTPDYRNETTAERQNHLEFYHFKCKCNYCAKGTDEELLKFHKYRCENSKCGAIFSPPTTNLCWWEEGSVKFLTCPSCRTKLDMEFYYNFEMMSSYSENIPKMLQMFEYSKHLLVGYNQLRKDMAMKVLRMFFDFRQDGISFSEAEFKRIGEVINFILDFIEQKNDLGLVYAAKSSFALDLMAQGYKFGFNFEKIHKAFNALPNEMRIIFENYIDDYIGADHVTSDQVRNMF